MGMFDDLIPQQGAPAPAGRAGQFDDLIPTSQPEPARPAAQPSTGSALTRYAADIGRSIEAGADRGIAGLMGAPADVAGLIPFVADHARAYATGRPYEDV